MNANRLDGGRLGSDRDDFVEEIDYAPMKKPFLDRISLPGILIAVGCLALILLLSFLVVRVHTSGLRTRLVALEDRIESLENRFFNVDGVPALVSQIEAHARQVEALNSRINRVEATMPTIVDQIKKELDNLQKKTAGRKPQPGADNAAAGATASTPAGQPSQPVYHTVSKGETLYGISRIYKDRYGLSVDKIREINNLGANSMIRPGQKLIVGP
jgi:LysM repeat protein